MTINYDGVDDQFKSTLSEVVRQQSYNFATQLAFQHANFHSRFANLDAVIQRSTDTLERVVDHVQNTIQKSNHAIHKELQDTRNVLDATRHDFFNTVSDLKEQVKALSDEVATTWRRAGCTELRQFIKWILTVGLDTTAAAGVSPVIAFHFLDAKDLSEANHVTIISKALLPQLTVFGSDFNPPLSASFLTALNRTINGACHPLNVDVNKLHLTKTFPYTSPARKQHYVIRTSMLVRMLQEEFSYETKQQGMMKSDADITAVTRVVNGNVEMGREAAKSKFKSLKLASIDLRPEGLRRHGAKLFPRLSSAQALHMLSCHRYFGLEASLEYLSSPAVRKAISWVNREVFQREEDGKEAVHLDVDWNPDVEVAVRPFVDIIAEHNQMTREEFLTLFHAATVVEEPPGGKRRMKNTTERHAPNAKKRASKREEKMQEDPEEPRSSSSPLPETTPSQTMRQQPKLKADEEDEPLVNHPTPRKDSQIELEDDDEEEENAEMSIPLRKRGRGRPSSKPNNEDEKEEEEEEDEEQQPGPAPKRNRGGRFQAKDKEESGEAAKSPRRRGRPPTATQTSENQDEEETESEEEAITARRRGPGRPPKTPSSSSSSTPAKRGPGRPRKILSDNDTETASLDD